MEIGVLEAAVQRSSVKKVFLEICKIHRKIPVPKSLFNKVGLRPATLLTKETLTQLFSCEISRTYFLIGHPRWLLLEF